MRQRPSLSAPITFFYYDDLARAARFYEDVLGLEIVDDQGWAKLYRVSPGAFFGIVDAGKGFHPARAENSVVLTLVTDDVEGWYTAFSKAGATLLTSIKVHDEIRVKCFFARDPGGYVLEIQSFLDPQVAERFGQPPVAG